jgi:hypothetical protein
MAGVLDSNISEVLRMVVREHERDPDVLIVAAARYLNMDLFKEPKKLRLSPAA